MSDITSAWQKTQYIWFPCSETCSFSTHTDAEFSEQCSPLPEDTKGIYSESWFTPELHKCLLLCLNAQQRRYKAGTIQSQEDVCHCWTDHMLDLMSVAGILTQSVQSVVGMCWQLKSHDTLQLCTGLTVYVTCPHLHVLVMTEVDLKRSLHL